MGRWDRVITRPSPRWGSQALHGLQVNEKLRTPPLDTPFASVRRRVGVVVGEWVDDGGATGAGWNEEAAPYFHSKLIGLD